MRPRTSESGTWFAGSAPGTWVHGSSPGSQVSGSCPGSQVPGSSPGSQVPGSFPGAQWALVPRMVRTDDDGERERRLHEFDRRASLSGSGVGRGAGHGHDDQLQDQVQQLQQQAQRHHHLRDREPPCNRKRETGSETEEPEVRLRRVALTFCGTHVVTETASVKYWPGYSVCSIHTALLLVETQCTVLTVLTHIFTAYNTHGA